MRHIDVFREKGRFAGWPANYGIWSWGNEIVVGFTLGHANPKGGFHARDTSRPFLPMQARSLDGGETWEVDDAPLATPGNRGISADEHMDKELTAAQALAQGLENMPQDPPGGINFAHPDFALMCARTGLGAGTTAWFYISYDRCRSWDGPYALPTFGLPGIEARTDYIVSGPNTCGLFLTAAKPSGEEGGGIFYALSQDGGKTFQLVSWVTRMEEGHAIMPSSVRMSESRLLCAARCRRQANNWIDLFVSEDGGRSWEHLSRPAPNTGRGGNPPALLKLRDGRICLVHGYRDEPFGMRARISTDGGETWDKEIILREDGGNHDLGYPRAVQRPDGQVVTVYYYNQEPEGERYIAATIFQP